MGLVRSAGPSSTFSVLESVALALGFQDVTTVSQAIQRRSRESLATGYLGPVLERARVAESESRCDVSKDDIPLLPMSTHVLVAIDATERQLHIRRRHAVEILLLSQADQLVVGELKDF